MCTASLLDWFCHHCRRRKEGRKEGLALLSAMRGGNEGGTQAAGLDAAPGIMARATPPPRGKPARQAASPGEFAPPEGVNFELQRRAVQKFNRGSFPALLGASLPSRASPGDFLPAVPGQRGPRVADWLPALESQEGNRFPSGAAESSSLGACLDLLPSNIRSVSQRGVI